MKPLTRCGRASSSILVLLLLALSIISATLTTAPQMSQPATGQSPSPVHVSQYSQPPGSTPATGSFSPSVNPPAWTDAAPIPTAREGYGAAEVKGIFYYITGYGSNGDSVVNEAYNASSNTWTTRASLPSGPRSETVAVTDGTYVYLIGGRSVPSVGHDLWRYSPASDSWTNLAPMPTARATEHMAVYYQGRIYVAGGRTSGEPTAPGDLSTLEIYDIASNTWTTGSSMPQPLADGSAILFNNRIYIFGGFTTSGMASASTYIYDISSDTWTTGSSSPAGELDPAVGVCGSLVYMIGGSTAQLQLQSSNFVYDPTTDRWNSSLPMPLATAETQAISYNSQIYVISGGIFGSGAGNHNSQVFHCVDNRLVVSPAVRPAQASGTTVSYAIKVVNFQPLIRWDIAVSTDQSVINPQTISISGNLFQTNFTATVTELSNCVNGAGTGCTAADGPGIAHSAASIQFTPPTNATLSGLLFTITYRVVGGSYSPVMIMSNSQLLDPTSHPIPHATSNGVYGRPPPNFTIGVLPIHIFVGQLSSNTASILITSLNSFTGNVSLSALVAPVGTAASPSGPTVNFSTNPVSVKANQTGVTKLTITSTMQLGNYGNYSISVTGKSGLISHTTVIIATIVPDFTITVTPTSETMVPGGFFTGTVTVTSRGFTGTLQLSTFSTPATTEIEFSLNTTSVSLFSGQTATVRLAVFTLVDAPPGSYTLAITASGVISHSATISLNLLPPILTLTPSQGPVGTTITIHGSNFPFFPGSLYDETVYVNFDDQFIGYVPAPNGTFTFVLNVPLAQPGQHLIKAHDYNTGAVAISIFTVLPTLNPLSVNIQIGTVYFPGDTAVITILTSQAGTSSLTGVGLLVVLIKPDGSNISLPTKSVAPGLFRATYSVPTTGPLGTYGVLAKATITGQPTTTALQTFQVKLSWLNSNGQNMVGAATVAGVLGLVGLAWKKGYFGRKIDTPVVTS